MRRLLITALLASVAAAPALAAPADRDAARAERQQEREDRQNAREVRRESSQQAEPEPAEPAVELRARGNDGVARAEAVGRADRESLETIRVTRDAERLERIENRQEVRDQRIETNRINRGLRQAERPVPNVLRQRVPLVSATPRENTQPPAKAEVRRYAPVNWSTHWRNDRRYDWYNWRKRNRWLFNLGYYYDPFGWGYRPYSIGWRMWPSYYGSQFWLTDPWQYRLPYAPPGYRWIRYYDDAILIDTWDGRVVDVIYNFFW